MNKIEKIKLAVDVAIYYFIINTVLYILPSLILPYLFFRNISGLRYAIVYVPLIVVSIFLVIISNVLKRKVQGDISIDSKPLLYLIVGVLFIITGVTSKPVICSIINWIITSKLSIERLYVYGCNVYHLRCPNRNWSLPYIYGYKKG